jgi:hypothetical protein
MPLIPTRRTWQCRCNRRVCQDRATLPKHPDEYRRKPRCRHCKAGYYRVDGYRSTGREQHPVCDPVKTGCDGYSFPHRLGSGACCANPNLTMEQRQERYERGAWA